LSLPSIIREIKNNKTKNKCPLVKATALNTLKNVFTNVILAIYHPKRLKPFVVSILKPNTADRIYWNRITMPSKTYKISPETH
jgi:hypothetical protein